MNRSLRINVVLAAIDNMTRVAQQAANQSVKHLQRIQKQSQQTAETAFNVGRTTGAMGLAILGPVGLALNAAADYEQMNIALRTSFQGNQEAADAAFSTVQEFAAKTPYELQEVMTGFIKLKNMGLDPSMQALEAYGNIASGMGKSLNDMVEAVADAATGEFERLKEFGIRASSEGDRVSFTFQGVTTTIGKNAAEIERYLQGIGMTKFAGGIEAQSQSLRGKFSTLKDNVMMTAASMANTLIPVINDLFATISPILEQVGAWVTANPELAKTIMMVTVGIGLLAIAVSGISFVLGGLATAVGYASAAFGFFGSVLTFIAANPIVLIIAAIAAAAYLIYDNWEAISAWFANLWDSVVSIFTDTWEFIKNLFLNYTPHGLIIKHWDTIVEWFSGLWDRFVAVLGAAWEGIKYLFLNYTPHGLIYQHWDAIVGWFGSLWGRVTAKFEEWFGFLTSIPSRMFEAGSNIVQSIWDGMASKFDAMIAWFEEKVAVLREYLPFSPAKRGPLSDIHRIKLVETIAQNIKPGPMVQAMEASALAVRRSVPQVTGLTDEIAVGSMGGGGRGQFGGPTAQPGSGVTVNFQPTITLSGAATEQDRDNMLNMLRQFQPELLRMIQDAMARQARVAF